MKSFHLFLLVMLFIPGTIFSQLGWGSVYRYMDATPYRGKKFPLRAAIKVQAIDSTANCQLWVRLDKADKDVARYYRTADPIRLNEWKVYTLTGEISKEASQLFLGGMYLRRGLFWFDDFKLYIEGANKKMEEVPLPEAGFEGDSVSVAHAWPRIYKETGKGALHVLTGTGVYAGAQSMMADASRLQYEPVYGSNDSAGKYIAVGNIRMYYETYGSGEPLLLLHGNSASIKSFKYQIPALAKKYKVIALDSRGQGKSSEDGTKFTYELFAADTKAFLDQLQLDSLNIVGWSDGGNIGLILAMKYPEKVKSLVTMGANLYNNRTSVRADVNKFIKKEYAKLSDTSRADIFRKRMYDLLLYEPNIEAKELAAIHCPVLVLAGSDDLIKEEHTKLIAASIKNAQLYIFPNGTHDEPSERPARFNKAVMDFLNANKR